MKSIAWLMLLLFVVLALPVVAEARCGGRGIFRGRQPVRTFLRNHRPHLFHRGCGG